MKKIFALCFVFLLILLCGCDIKYREIDRGYLVTAIGFEQQESSLQIYIEAISSSEIEKETNARIVLNGHGDTLEKAFKSLKSQLAKPLYFEQIGCAVFSPLLILEGVNFLLNIPNINLGIFVIQSDSVKTLFEGESPNGLLGYDIVGLLKTHNKGTSRSDQLFEVQNREVIIPKINFAEGKLLFDLTGDNYGTK